MKRMTVMITTYNREDFVATCIASVARVASPDLHLRILVMDNGSGDSTPEVLARAAADMPAHATLEIHRTDDNRRVPSVYNRGFGIAYAQPCDYLMMMNDDTEFLPGALEQLLAACDAHPKSMLTPLQRNYREPERVDAMVLGLMRKVDAFLEDSLMGRPLQQVYALETISGAAMLARTEVWQAIGPWDENFWFYGPDDDICNRATHLGFQNLIVPGSHLLHAHGKLGARATEQNKAGQRLKWKRETQARYWFLLKSPARSFPLAFLALTRRATQDVLECLLAKWPWGAVQTIAIYAWFATRLPYLARIRAEHFR